LNMGPCLRQTRMRAGSLRDQRLNGTEVAGAADLPGDLSQGAFKDSDASTPFIGFRGSFVTLADLLASAKGGATCLTLVYRMCSSNLTGNVANQDEPLHSRRCVKHKRSFSTRKY